MAPGKRKVDVSQLRIPVDTWRKTQLAGGEPPLKRAARGKRGDKQATGTSAFGVADGDDVDATIDELPAWARTAKSASPPATEMQDKDKDKDKEEQGKNAVEEQANATSNKDDRKVVAEEEEEEEDAASQSVTQPVDELQRSSRDESKSVGGEMCNVKHSQQEPAPASASAAAVIRRAAEQPRAIGDDSVAHVRLFLEDDGQAEPPSPPALPVVVARSGGKSRAQAMVAAAASLPRATPAVVPREDSPPPEAADAKALAARERFMKNRELARSNTRSLGAPTKTHTNRPPVRQEDLSRLIENKIAKKARDDHILSSISQSSPAPSAAVANLPDPKSLVGRPLPVRCNRMVKQFDCLDTALAFAKARSSAPALFVALQASVQELTRRDFLLADLRRVMAIAPWAYRCEWAWKESKWQLALSFQFASDNDRDSLHRERPSTSALRTRKLAFNEAVSSAVTERHTAFLLAGKYPDPGPSTWHPRFPLESLEELPLAPLPPRPNEEKLTGGTSSKELRAGVECASPSIQAAISSVIGMRIKQEAEEAAAAAAAAVATRPVHKALEGLSPALIAKVRAREAKMAASGLGGGGSVIKERETVSRLPVIIEMIHTFFRMRGARRNACPLDELTAALASQSTDSTVTRKDINLQVMALVEKVPQWCSVSMVGKVRVLTIVPDYPMSAVRASVKGMTEALKSK